MDLNSPHDDELKNKRHTPKKGSKNQSQTPKKSSSGKKKSKLSIKKKFPILPLYNDKKTSKVCKITVNDILKPVESLDNGFVSSEPVKNASQPDTLEPTPSYRAAEILMNLGRSTEAQCEEDAALSVLEVSDFHSCMRGRPNEGSEEVAKVTKTELTSVDKTDNLKSDDYSNASSPTDQPSTTNASSTDQPSTANNHSPNSAKAGFQVMPFYSDLGNEMNIPKKNYKKLARYEALFSDELPLDTKTSPVKQLDSFPESDDGRRQAPTRRVVIIEERGVDNTLTVKCPKTVVSPLNDQIDDCDDQDMEISPDQPQPQNPNPETQNRKSNERPELVSFSCFMSVSGRKMEPKGNLLSHYRSLFQDDTDPVIQSKPVKMKTLGSKPGSDPFPDGDAELFEKLQTPTKCEEISEKQVLDDKLKCPNTVTSDNIEMENGNSASPLGVDFDLEVMPQSPILNMTCIDLPASPRLGFRLPEATTGSATVSLTDLQFGEKETSKHSCSQWEDFPELQSSQAALLEQSAPKKISIAPNDLSPLHTDLVDIVTCNGEIGDSGTHGEHSVLISPAKSVVDRSCCVQDLEQSPCKKKIAIPNGLSQSLRTDGVEFEIGLLTDENPGTRAKPSTSRKSKLGVVNANVTTPLSSRALLNGGVGNKRKSLPVSLEFAAKKPRTSAQAAQAITPIDIVGLKKIGENVPSSKKLTSLAPGTLSQKKRSLPQQQLSNIDGSWDNSILINSENAIHFRFRISSKDVVECKKLAESFNLLPKVDKPKCLTAGLDEVTEAFLSSPQVDPKLVPDGWVKNHYRWIVWKLVSYDRRFPQHFTRRCLSVVNVLLQLKYRYDREIDLAQRPAFKRILEGDAAPMKFICCLASVKKKRLDEPGSLLEFELTDGWYSIWSIIDSAMVDFYQKGVIGIGSKLVVHGAEITDCDQGCDPLNVPSNVKLSISTNSVRRARWDAKMGFLRVNSPISTVVCEVLPDGGTVGSLKSVIMRKYPVVYVSKDAQGKTIVRNKRAQEAFDEEWNKRKSAYIAEVRDELEKKAQSNYVHPSKRRCAAADISAISDPEELISIWDEYDDGVDMEFPLTSEQLKKVWDYKNELSSKMQKELQARLRDWESKSQVSTTSKLLKVRLMDGTSEKYAILSIWNPKEDEEDIILENKPIQFFNIKANGMREGVLQLSTTKQTTMDVLSSKTLELLQPAENLKRVVTPLSAIECPNFAPAFNELDTVGFVVLVKPPEQSSGVTVVYLSDLDGHYLSITFWTVLSVFGCEDLMKNGSLIACSNLQWRSTSSQKKKIPMVFASDTTSFTKNPEQNHLRLHLEQIKSSLVKDFDKAVLSAKSHVNEVLRLSKSRDVSSPGVGSPALSTASPAPNTPLRSTPGGTTKKPTPMSTSSKSTPVAQRLQRLDQFVNNAPPLPSMALTVSSGKIFQDFKSPCITPRIE